VVAGIDRSLEALGCRSTRSLICAAKRRLYSNSALQLTIVPFFRRRRNVIRKGNSFPAGPRPFLCAVVGHLSHRITSLTTRNAGARPEPSSARRTACHMPDSRHVISVLSPPTPSTTECQLPVTAGFQPISCSACCLEHGMQKSHSAGKMQSQKAALSRTRPER